MSRDRRKTLSTRITAETRALLEHAVLQSSRSLAQEIELRLERSFWEGMKTPNLEIEQWQGPFDKPRTTLVEVEYTRETRQVLRRFDLTSLELVQLTAEAFSIDPPETKIG